MRFPHSRVFATLALVILLTPLLAYGTGRGLRWADWRLVGADGVVFDEAVHIGEARHHLFVRSYDREAPLLLFLPGGPGESAVPYARTFTDDLQQRFVVAQVEFGVGKADPYPTSPDLNAYTADVLTVVERFAAAFDDRPVLIVGNSLGALHALQIARANPSAVSGVVTIGMPVHWPEGSALATAELRRRAASAGDQDTMTVLDGLPADLTSPDDPNMIDFAAVAENRRLQRLYGMDGVTGRHTPQDRRWTTLTTPTHGPRAACNLMWTEGSLCALVAPHPDWWRQWQDVIPGVLAFDARRDAPRLSVPVLTIVGEEDWVCPASLTRDYAEALQAPGKVLAEIEGVGHYAHLDAPDTVQALITAFAKANGIILTARP